MIYINQVSLAYTSAFSKEMHTEKVIAKEALKNVQSKEPNPDNSEENIYLIRENSKLFF